jgi:hypothetical protein
MRDPNLPQVLVTTAVHRPHRFHHQEHHSTSFSQHVQPERNPRWCITRIIPLHPTNSRPKFASDLWNVDFNLTIKEPEHILVHWMRACYSL